MKKNKIDLAKFEYEFSIGNGKCETTPVLKPSAEIKKRAVKKMKRLTATIEINGVKFNADETSISFMSSVLALANFKFNQALGSGMKAEDAFNAVYSQEIDWKDAEGIWRKVKLGDIGNNLESAMKLLAKIISE